MKPSTLKKNLFSFFALTLSSLSYLRAAQITENTLTTLQDSHLTEQFTPEVQVVEEVVHEDDVHNLINRLKSIIKAAKIRHSTANQALTSAIEDLKKYDPSDPRSAKALNQFTLASQRHGRELEIIAKATEALSAAQESLEHLRGG